MNPCIGQLLTSSKDPNPNKMNLGVGAYRDDNGILFYNGGILSLSGQPFVLECVRKASAKLEAQNLNHEYAPIQGTVAAEFHSLISRNA
jgi:aspartate aminotransferase